MIIKTNVMDLSQLYGIFAPTAFNSLWGIFGDIRVLSLIME